MKRKIPWKAFAIGLIITGVIMLLFFTFFGNFINKGASFNPDLLSQYGSFVGGFIGALFSLAGSFLLFENLKLQSQQQSENIFFQYLNFHNENVKGLSIEWVQHYDNSPFFLEKDKFDNRKYFTYIKKELQEYFWACYFEQPNEYTTEVKQIELANFCYENLFKQHINELGHYYRNLYNVFKLVNNNWKGDSIKGNYYNIIRAQLSQDELFLLYYNFKSENGKGFKELIGDYDILKHLVEVKLENIDKTEWEKPKPFPFVFPENVI
jgi:putative phage abortive infection protein